LVRKLLYHETLQQRVIMRNNYKISLLVLASLASLPALASTVPEVDGSVALQLLVLAGGIVALLKKKKNDRK
jgi:hypothetical protein